MKRHQFGITNLGSGSSGNATVIHTPEGAILVDAGFSCRELLSRLASVSVAPETIKAVLISHEHSDHTKGCRVFSDTYRIPCCSTSITCRALADAGRIGERKILFSPGTPFPLAGITVEPFTVPHDARDTVAFNFLCNGCKISIATDLGHVNNLTVSRLSDCDALLLESNHDLKMLADSSRPLHLKRRIMSRHGHLSNEDAMRSLETLLSEKTRYLLFGHLSSECNDRNLVEAMAEERLDVLKRHDISFRIASQSVPSETFWVV